MAKGSMIDAITYYTTKDPTKIVDLELKGDPGSDTNPYCVEDYEDLISTQYKYNYMLVSDINFEKYFKKKYGLGWNNYSSGVVRLTVIKFNTLFDFNGYAFHNLIFKNYNAYKSSAQIHGSSILFACDTPQTRETPEIYVKKLKITNCVFSESYFTNNSLCLISCGRRKASSYELNIGYFNFIEPEINLYFSNDFVEATAANLGIFSWLLPDPNCITGVDISSGYSNPSESIKIFDAIIKISGKFYDYTSSLDMISGLIYRGSNGGWAMYYNTTIILNEPVIKLRTQTFADLSMMNVGLIDNLHITGKVTLRPESESRNSFTLLGTRTSRTNTVFFDAEIVNDSDIPITLNYYNTSPAGVVINKDKIKAENNVTLTCSNSDNEKYLLTTEQLKDRDLLEELNFLRFGLEE